MYKFCACVHVRVCLCVCVLMCLRVCAHVRMSAGTCECMLVCACAWVVVRACVWYARVLTRVCQCVPMPVVWEEGDGGEEVRQGTAAAKSTSSRGTPSHMHSLGEAKDGPRTPVCGGSDTELRCPSLGGQETLSWGHVFSSNGPFPDRMRLPHSAGLPGSCNDKH